MDMIPEWLRPLLEASFFNPCQIHPSKKNECNMYCLDCTGHALCCYCCPEHIQRASNHDVVKASEISKFFDISDVQRYTNHKMKLVFLNERPNPRLGTGHPEIICEICHRGLMDSVRFCCLGCKLRGMMRGNTECIVAECTEVEKELILHTGSEPEELPMSKRQKISNMGQNNCTNTIEGSGSGTVDFASLNSPKINTNRVHRRRRKGIPHRAPFY